jgi:hypothetical protein
MKPLPDDVLDALLTEPTHRYKVNLSGNCSTCGVPKTDGYCRNNECAVDTPTPTFDCMYCGHCSTPNDKCVWGVTCPRCGAEPMELCTRQGGYEALHKERWELVS